MAGQTLARAAIAAVAAAGIAATGCFSAGAGRDGKTTLKVCTYNIRLDSRRDEAAGNGWNARRGDLAALVRKMAPDAGGMQEVTPGQRRYLEQALPEYAFLGDHRGSDRVSGEASPVFYRKDRFDEEESGTFWLSETPDTPGRKGWDAAYPRICTWALLRDRKTGRRFCLANTHTDHIGAIANKEGMLLILRRMKKFSKGAPVVFTGDHNCIETDEPARAVSALLDNATRVSRKTAEGPWRTYNAWIWKERESSPAKDGARVDYIYVSRGTEVLDCKTWADARPGLKQYPSDHFPVTATVSF